MTALSHAGRQDQRLKPKRALWASTSARGGMSTFVATIRETTLWNDWNIRLISTHTNGSARNRLLGFAKALVQFLVELTFRRPDVVHVNSAAYGSFVRKGALAWLSKLYRIPVVLHMHGADFLTFYSEAPRSMKPVIRLTIEHMDAVVALGSAWADSLRAIAPKANVTVVPNAIRPIAAVDQRVLGTISVVFLGEIGDRKGTFTLIDAWKKVLSDFDGAFPGRLMIAGDGAVGQARERVDILGLGSTVDVRDWMPSSEVSQVLSETQILVLPSRDEGQPMAILEAMARGICVVASDVGGIPELLANGCGVLVAPDNVDQLAKAIRRVLIDEDTRTSYGENAYARVRDEFDVDVVSRRFDQIYRDICR